jgi:predicted nucleotidyltransferase component of viral defense system
MSANNPSAIRFHEDAAFFREAVDFTAAGTGFPPRLIEKDYFASALLADFAGVEGLVFKGGTCLAKVHVDFYRLSEDLDFTLPLPGTASRSERSERANRTKEAFATIPRETPCFHRMEPLRGGNRSTQYVGKISYVSVLNGQEESIKVEVSLREPLLAKAMSGSARTILLDPVSGGPLVAPVPLACISLMEAFAEKFRAALTRREAAIRDFFDIDYAVRKLSLSPRSAELVDLVRKKLAVRCNEAVKIGHDRLTELRGQWDAHLKPVLRKKDFDEFDLDRAFNVVAEMAQAIQ